MAGSNTMTTTEHTDGRGNRPNLEREGPDVAEFIELTNEGDVRVLTLDAPHRRNALDRAMLAELSEAIDTVAHDSSARALVVTGRDKAFCAGADLGSLFGDTTRPTSTLRDQLRETYSRFLPLRELTIPTVSAVNGVAVGAGINIALACDVVVAGPRAKFAVTFADIGLHPGGGCSWFLARRMGPGRALAAILGGAQIGAQEALSSGIADILADEPLDHALQLAQRYASLDPELVKDATHAVRMSMYADLPDVLQYEAWAQAASVGREGFQRYLEAFDARSSRE